MKSFRLWLVVLLAVLLPLRGALAAAMMCPVAGTGGPTDVHVEVHMAQHAPEHAHHHAQAHDHQAATDLAFLHADHHHVAPAGESADKCNLCSAFCSVTGMVSGQGAVAGSQAGPTVFSCLDARLASFVPEGQERPPRTI